MKGSHTYSIQMSSSQPPDPVTSCANYQLTSFIPRLRSEVTTLFSDCQEGAEPDQPGTVDISHAVLSPGSAEVSIDQDEQTK